ncbi:MAG: hypothetical protein M3418_11005 [Gemmatimonadota bacterium]|nr:hypothetical protein [Gemmatimonadota bacterium]
MNNDSMSADSAEPDVCSVTAILIQHDEAEANGLVSLADVWVRGEIDRLRDADHVYFRMRDVLLRSVEDSARSLERSIDRALQDVKERLQGAELSLTRLSARCTAQGASDPAICPLPEA